MTIIFGVPQFPVPSSFPRKSSSSLFTPALWWGSHFALLFNRSLWQHPASWLKGSYLATWRACALDKLAAAGLQLLPLQGRLCLWNRIKFQLKAGFVYPSFVVPSISGPGKKFILISRSQSEKFLVVRRSIPFMGETWGSV